MKIYILCIYIRHVFAKIYKYINIYIFIVQSIKRGSTFTDSISFYLLKLNVTAVAQLCVCKLISFDKLYLVEKLGN